VIEAELPSDQGNHNQFSLLTVKPTSIVIVVLIIVVPVVATGVIGFLICRRQPASI
jgi:hypothetical protein